VRVESVDTYQRLTHTSHISISLSYMMPLVSSPAIIVYRVSTHIKDSHVSHTYITRISHVSHTYLTRIKDSHQGTHVMSRRCLGGNSFLSTLPTLTSHRCDDCASYRGYERVTSCHGMKESRHVTALPRRRVLAVHTI